MGIEYVDLSDIVGVNAYKAGLGAEVIGEDSLIHMIDNIGVANHPGDNGMKLIADRIISFLD